MKGKYVDIISSDVFAADWKALNEKIKREKPQKPEGAERWKAWAPNKVWTSRVIKAPVDGCLESHARFCRHGRLA